MNSFPHWPHYSLAKTIGAPVAAGSVQRQSGRLAKKCRVWKIFQMNAKMRQRPPKRLGAAVGYNRPSGYCGRMLRSCMSGKLPTILCGRVGAPEGTS